MPVIGRALRCSTLTLEPGSAMTMSSSRPTPPRDFARPDFPSYRAPGWVVATAVISGVVVLSAPVMPWNANVVFLAIVAVVSTWAASYAQHVRRSGEHDAAVEHYNRAVFHHHLAQRQHWEATRPMTTLAASPEPLATATGVMAAAKVLTFFGVVADTRCIVGGTAEHSVVVVGPTGVGKTTGILNPSVLMAPGAALVVTSKPQDAVTTMGARMARGRVWLYDPTNTIGDNLLPAGVERIYWDPLFDCQRYDRAKLVADHLISSSPGTNSTEGNAPFFATLAKNLLAGLTFVAANHIHLNVGEIYDWIESQNLNTARAVAYAISSDLSHPHHKDAVRVLAKLDNVEHHHPKMRDSIFTTAQVALDAYDFTEVRNYVGRHNFAIEEFIASSDTVYVCAPAEYQRAVVPVLTLFVEEVYRLRAAATTEARRQGVEVVPLLAAFDEAAHIATLPQMPRFLAEGRGNGFVTLMLLQTLGQARELWGEKGKTIFDAAAIKVAFGGVADSETLAQLSVLTGDWDREYHSTSESWSASTNEGTSSSQSWSPLPTPSRATSSGTSESVTFGRSTNSHKERRISDGDISSMPRGYALVLGGGEPARPVELVNSHLAPWQAVIAAAEARALRPTPVYEVASPALAHDPGQLHVLEDRYAAYLTTRSAPKR